MDEAKPKPLRYTFPASHRLRSAAEYADVYDAKTRESRGPLTIYSLPNELGHCRLGMSVSRKVGIAVKRNRIRRLLREAYRHARHELPGAYDLVVVVRPHEPLVASEYQTLLRQIVAGIHAKWSRRSETTST